MHWTATTRRESTQSSRSEAITKVDWFWLRKWEKSASRFLEILTRCHFSFTRSFTKEVLSSTVVAEGQTRHAIDTAQATCRFGPLNIHHGRR